ncbi:ORF6C domain-containing protein [Arcobacter lanthieri]|uniref:ORF6C domain-containing protein n=1 Tax=Aliarcobacter lanthieri TaxID=1355374 RepID=UPI0019217F26|nr:ORF6C domain-containing protein [Aliarcobacter lanthieri]MBL3520283.1 ORF6C domain-containing protein [Aliarcobacter lanthieri]
MSANIQINTTLTKDEIKITLKEITDLISVEHNKAMKIVEKLTNEASFGQVEKTATCITIGNGAVRDIDTYLLTKKQAIAVGAKLNNSLLMKLVDRLEQLENQNKPKTTLDLIIQSAQKMQELENIQINQGNRLSELEKSKRLENWQEKELQDLKNKKVYEIAKKHDLENDKEMIRKLHSRVWKFVKNRFNLPRYNELPILKFDDAKTLISGLSLGDLI